MNPQSRKAIIRLAILFGAIPIAFLVGYLTRSEEVFIVVMAIGLGISIVLRLTILR